MRVRLAAAIRVPSSLFVIANSPLLKSLVIVTA